MDERIIAVDFYNLTLTGGVCMTISGAASDSHHIPCVIIEQEPSIAVKINGKTESNSVGSENSKE